MTQTASTTTTQTVETPAAASAPALADGTTQTVAAPTQDAANQPAIAEARAPVPAPEKDAAAAAAAGVMPPEKPTAEIPKPPIHSVAAPTTEAANDPVMVVANQFERDIAPKIGAELAKLGISTDGLNVTVTIDRSPAAAAASDASVKPAAPGHCTGGPGCAHCTATKDVAHTAAAAAPAVEIPTVEQPNAETKPRVIADATEIVPAMQIPGQPKELQGKIAANELASAKSA